MGTPTDEQNSYLNDMFGLDTQSYEQAGSPALALADAGAAEPSGGAMAATADAPAGGAATPQAPADQASADQVAGGGGPAAGGKTVTIEFNSFIPGALGKKYSSFDHPTDLANQAAFEGMLGGVSGTWLPEPGDFAIAGYGAWHFETDNRGYGGGSHRVGSTGTVDTSAIGSMKGKGGAFKHTTSGSSHVRWKHTGTFTSSGETGSLDGPYHKNSNVSGSVEYTDPSSDSSVVVIVGAGSYPFAKLAPNIDYRLVLTFTRDAAGNVTVSGDITTNKFPFYELLLNGTRVWNYASSDSGPGIVNLNSSDTSKLAPTKV